MKLSQTNLPYSIPDTQHWELKSENVACTYQIFTYKPNVPAPEEGYPVLYVLDANATFGSIVEAVRLQTRQPKGYDPTVVVGIGYQTDGPFDITGRFRDFTVEAADNELLPRGDGKSWPKNGGADAFLKFINEELKPEIQTQFSINTNRQALFGHSLGGFFALYTLFTNPSAFQCYIAGSPSIWWKNRYLIELEKSFSEKVTADQGESAEVSKLLLAVGGKEVDFMIADAEQMYQQLRADVPNLHVAYRLFKGEDHVPVIHPLISKALRFMLDSDGEKD
ncbi:alpha/beta hydrolase-fold protein [Sporolactobacillus shoreicorticis]|uniref:Alpha/beta hydrolase n=1 Tax=Sporolactobacillus shoreicorticis TaxID=1923877 RepID=A0ABW5S228_9BACL|nr:alpha/beta hydrolase-fold protein [Sporolactobacillus shoreicorticis]MCO7126539.1 alpha/beta hydrolase-fold protein [Sporolactobacillus shoreicorticis]